MKISTKLEVPEDWSMREGDGKGGREREKTQIFHDQRWNPKLWPAIWEVKTRKVWKDTPLGSYSGSERLHLCAFLSRTRTWWLVCKDTGVWPPEHSPVPSSVCTGRTRILRNKCGANPGSIPKVLTCENNLQLPNFRGQACASIGKSSSCMGHSAEMVKLKNTRWGPLSDSLTLAIYRATTVSQKAERSTSCMILITIFYEIVPPSCIGLCCTWIPLSNESSAAYAPWFCACLYGHCHV